MEGVRYVKKPFLINFFSKLVSSLAELGKLEEALSTLRKAGQTDPTFTLTGVALQNVVESYLR